MSDSNLQRDNIRKCKLTALQFSRQLGSIKAYSLPMQNVDRGLCLNNGLLVQSVLEIKTCGKRDELIYPLATAYFALGNLHKSLGITVKVDYDTKPSLSLYVVILELEKSLMKLMLLQNYFYLWFEETDFNEYKKILANISQCMYNITQICGFDLQHVLWLGIEFYKEFPIWKDSSKLHTLEASKKKSMESVQPLQSGFLQQYMPSYMQDTIETTLKDGILSHNQLVLRVNRKVKRRKRSKPKVGK